MSNLLEQWRNEDAAGGQGNGVRMALEASGDLTAQKAARAIQLAKDLGLPENFVARNPYGAEQERIARQLEKSPTLAAFMEQDRLNAALLREDVEPMAGSGGVFDTIARLWNRETEAAGRAWDAGQAQREAAQHGNRYLAALQSGDMEAAAQFQAQAREIEIRANPYAEQEAFGIERPGTVETTAVPHVREIGGKAVLLPSVDGEGNPLAEDAAAALFLQDGQHAGVFSSLEAARGFLSQPEARRRELFANWKQKPDSWIESTFGPGAGIEQLPRMLFDQLPTQANRAAWGAAAGFGTGAALALAGGQMGPQVAVPEEVVTVPVAATAGFALGAKTGWSIGAAEAAFYAERGSFALDLARERDVNGQALSPETIVVAANAYGLLSAAVEGVGEAAFLALLKPLGLGIADKAGLNRFIRSAVRNAARDKSTGAALLDLGARLAANAGVEGIEEGTQEALAVFTDFVAKNYENAANDTNFSPELFSEANAARIGEAMREGAVAGFWLGSGPIIVSSALDVQNAREAADYSEKHLALHEKVEGTNTKQLSPERMQSVLEAAGSAMSERVDLPADALMELYQGGTDLLTPLGISEADAGKAADAGHALTVPISKLHAYLDQQQFEAAARIMRRNPEALNAAEAARMDERLAADVQRVVELYQENAAVFDELAAEKNRLHTEVSKAIHEVPGLRSQVEALAGDVDGYANTWLDAVERFALRMGASGQNPVEVFQRITLDSLRGARRAAITPESLIDADLTELAAKEAAEAGSAPAPAGGLRHLNAGTMDDVYALAEQTQDQFYADVESWAGELGGAALFRTDRETGQRTLKNRARAERKLPEYDGDAARVVDILGGTILFDTRDQVEAAAEQIRRRIEASGGTVVRDKNRFANPAGGYKDYQFNYRYSNGFTVELQLNTRAMSEAKESIGHGLYELQDVAEKVISDEGSNETEKAAAKIVCLLSRDVSVELYGSTGVQSNETASFSVILEPFERIEAATPLLAGTSVYGKLSELLDTMRNKLPSLLNTYGSPSQSINSLTNTGEPSESSSTRTTGREATTLSSNARTSGEMESAMTEPPLDEGSIAQNRGQNNRPGKIIGSETTILGKGTSEQAHYEVWELDDVIPSHDPENGFARREDYPATAQERPYHSDVGEQEKVRGNALSYQPAFVVNSDPTAGNGPPIITREGIVLGGNSRTMTLQLVYADRPDSAAAYRQALTDQAAGFGLEPAALEGMRRPILVRVVDGRMTPEEMAVKSRLYNQTTTQKLQAKAEGVSRARMISPATLAALSADMADFDTLRQFLDSPRSKGFVRLLLQDGVIEQTEISSLTEKGGRLNDSGKKLVEDALRGMVVADYDVLEALPASVLNKLDRTIPALARLKARGEGWDMGHALTAALRIVGKAAAEGRKVEGWLGQVDLLDTDPDKKRPAVQALALTFANATQKEAAARFEVMAGEAERQTRGQGALIARPENRPGPAFVKAFLQPLVSVDGRTITGFDPRGNERHAALQWAYEHGGKGKTVSAALDRLQKTIGAKKSTPEQKAEAREMIRRLSEFSGAISMYPPKLGPYFRYQEGQELFQAAPATDSAAFKKWFDGSKVVDDQSEPLVVYHGTGATVGDDFGFDYKFLGKNGSAEGYGFYFTSDVNTAQGYQEKGGSLIKAYLNLQKPMPVKQKPFSRAVLKKILKRTVEKEIEQFPDETPDYKDSFLSNYADTYEMSFDRALNETVSMIYDADTALEQISEIANASGNKRGTAEAVRDVTGYDGVFANGYGDNGQEGGKIYVAWFPEQAKSIRNKGTWNSADPRILYQPVYHGTPHRFDRFSLDAIGTGEGNQSHGWGLYFAKDKNVSEDYRKALANSKEKYVLGGKAYTVDESNLYDIWRDDSGNEISGYEPVSYALRTYSDNNKDIAAAIEEIKEAIEILKKDASASTEVEEKALKLLEGGIQKKEPGQLFEVDIPENDVLLDEQKTLGEQPEKVQSALRALAQEHGLTLESQYPSIETTESGKTFWIKHPGGWEPAGAPRFRSRAKAEQWLKDNPDAFVIIQDGKRMYNELADRLGSPRAASLALNDLGVKGVTYDGAQDGRCFVVFDDKAINILQTYYQERDDPRGSVQIYPEGYLINLFQGADLSTLLHETGHIFFEEMERMVRAGAADETMRRDYETMRVWLGAEPGQTLTEEMREKAARGFEAYLMEGKAPSVELESAFARFRKWLLAIYRSATRLNAPLTDEVRGVFDRLLSSEREIAATAARNELLDLTARELDALGLTGTARTTAAGLMGKGREAAAQSLQKSRDANRKARQEKYTREARDEVRAMPVYRARSDLRRTPLDLEAVREGFGEDTARSLLKSLPGSARKDGGIDPEIFAAEHGYESAAAMFADVLNAPRQGDAIAEVARQKEARHDAEYDAFEHLMETREVSIQMELVGRKLAELLGAADIEREAYVRAAERELAAMPLGRAVQTGNFLAAMRRALRQSRTALAAGDRRTALDAHRKAMLNMEFVRLSRDLARRRDSSEGQIKRFIGMKKGDPDARYMVMDIGMRHGLVKFSAPLAESRDVRTVQAWMQGVKEDGYEIFADERILYGPGQPWREMSVADFESLVETVAQIVTVERNRRRLLTAKNKADLDEAAEEIAKSIFTHRKGKAIKTVEKQPAAIKALSGLHAIHTKIEALCLALDGDAMGAAWEYIYRPITEADDRQSERFREVRDALKGAGLFGAYTRKELALMGSRKELVPETGERLTWENRIAVALNMGNETNMGRLRDGHHWTDAQIAAVVRPLTARDWQFVQSVWDYIAGFKDEAFALQEEVTGLRPAAVEAKPLTVQTADGRTLELAGGYYPIKYNADKGFMAFAREQREMDRELFGGRNYGAAMTRNGHLKERAAGGMGSPLLLELSVITDHLFNVVHDLTYRKAVLDVAKIIRHSTVREAIESTVGAEMYRQLQPWLQDVANERQEPMHAVHRWARWARASTSIMQMGYKVTTILAQPLGITQTAELLGYKWTGVGLKHVYRNPMRLPELLEETFSRSPMMANRIRSFDREVRDIAKQLTPGMDRFAWVQTVRDKAFVPMGMVQMGVDLPTWWGAYAKGLQDFAGDEGRAARYADSIVRMSQGSGSTKDLARVQRGGDLLRLTTMFYSYFNTLYNLGAHRITALKQHHAPADIFQAANTALLLWFVPAVLGELLAARGPDDDEEPGEWAAMQILQYPFQAVVGIRDIASYVFGEYGYQITPAQAAPKALGQWFKSVNRALEKGDAGEVAKPTAEALGYLFGLPMKQPIITCGNLWDFVTGEDPDFAVRDLFFVKPK